MFISSMSRCNAKAKHSDSEQPSDSSREESWVAVVVVQRWTCLLLENEVPGGPDLIRHRANYTWVAIGLRLIALGRLQHCHCLACPHARHREWSRWWVRKHSGRLRATRECDVGRIISHWVSMAATNLLPLLLLLLLLLSSAAVIVTALADSAP